MQFLNLGPGGRFSGALAAVIAVQVQGPSNGSPFTDAPLPFEALKAAPDSAFDILMASLAMMLLSAIAAGVFLGCSKLRAIEETLRKEAARDRSEREAAAEAQVAALAEAVQGAVQAGWQEALEEGQGARPGGRGTSVGPGPEFGDVLAGIGDRLESSMSASATGVREAIEGALGGLVDRLESAAADQASRAAEEAAGGSAAGSSSGAAAGRSGGGAPAQRAALVAGENAQGHVRPTPASLLDRLHTRLAAMGFEAIEVVTPREEITPRLMKSGELIVEARRQGVVHKGKVTVSDGLPSEVSLRPSHSIFP